MDAYEFADRHLYPYKTRGNEIIALNCPYCHGGSHRDKHTFALNTENLTYNCKRGSCGAEGIFTNLCKDFDEVADIPAKYRREKTYETRPRRQVEYKTPETIAEKPVAGSLVEQYLRTRGINRSTWAERGVMELNGNIVFPYYENLKLVLVKFRPAHEIAPGEKKGWREKGGKPVFWGMDNCKPDKPLVIVEGEIDALTLDECGVENVVSVPSGNEDLTCLDVCWDWISQFNQVTLWVDNDEPGMKLQRNLINRLGAWRCKIVVVAERKDANEVLTKDGKGSVYKAIFTAVEVPISGLIRLADVAAFDYSNVVRVRSGIRGLDKVIGGLMMGEVSLWTGINASGKSTILGQVLLEAVDQGFSVCAYSGELPAPVFRFWLDLQAAGPRYLEVEYDSIREAEVARPRREILPYIRDWYRDKFFLHDSFGGTTDKNLLEVFEYAARRYNCKVFAIDNLMTTTFGGSSDSDFYRKQSVFVGQVMDFAHKFGVHCHLVAHPRKVTGRLTKADVSGSGDITNRPDNVFSAHRLTPEESENGHTTELDVFKNRFSGRQDLTIRLQFLSSCKRFYWADEVNPVKDYSWVNLLPQNNKKDSDDTLNSLFNGVEVDIEF